MRLNNEFYRLPLCFDIKQLMIEINAFDESDWCPHPQGFAGNSALLLISANGDPSDDGMMGPMLPTPLLEKCPYLKQVLASFGTVFGRTRLMRLEGNYEANLHMDASYYWHQRMRVHVPIQTHPEVDFLCGDKKVHMSTGESWIFDTWKKHNVINPVNKTRIHLVADTVGSARFQRLINQAWCPFIHKKEIKPTEFITFNPNENNDLLTEHYNFPVIMTPWEQESLLRPMLDELSSMKTASAIKVISIINIFMQRWKATWHTYGDSLDAVQYYQHTLNIFDPLLNDYKGQSIFDNRMEAVGLIKHAVFDSALNPHLREIYSRNNSHSTISSTPIVVNDSNNRLRTPAFGEAVIIIAAPRSGSSLLFETLAQSPDLFSIGGESHHIIESIKSLTPQENNFDSNVLTEVHANKSVISQIRNSFMKSVYDRDGGKVKANIPPIKLLEKTPKNSLRIPFLNKIFPNAKFIYLQRNPRENISSIIDAWKSNKFITYKELPNREKPWSLLLTPNWKQLPENNIATIAANQWKLTHEIIMSDFRSIDSNRVTTVHYEDLIKEPKAVINKLCKFANFTWDQNIPKTLPLAKHTLTQPHPDKWKKNENDLKRVLPIVEETHIKLMKWSHK